MFDFKYFWNILTLRLKIFLKNFEFGADTSGDNCQQYLVNKIWPRFLHFRCFRWCVVKSLEFRLQKAIWCELKIDQIWKGKTFSLKSYAICRMLHNLLFILEILSFWSSSLQTLHKLWTSFFLSFLGNFLLWSFLAKQMSSSVDYKTKVSRVE